MPTEQFANDAFSVLASGISKTDTSLTLVSASSFPAVPQFRIRVDNEIMLVTAVSGNTFTVTRAYEVCQGVQATDIHGANALVTQVLTVGSISSLGGGGASVPTGSVTAYAGSSTPSGFLFCNGNAVSRTTFSDLFAVIGTKYGAGNGSTTFNVPDIRGSVVIGVGSGSLVETITEVTQPTGNLWSVPSNADRWITGQAVTFLAPNGAPTGFTNGTTYYVIRQGATQIRLASSVTNALANTWVSYSSAGTGPFTITRSFNAKSLADRGGENAHQIASGEIYSGNLKVSVDESGSVGPPDGLSVLAGSDQGDAGYALLGGVSPNSPANITQPYIALNWIIKT